MEKLSMPQIIGILMGSQSIVEIELRVSIDIYGDNIPVSRVKEILESLQKRIKNSEEFWENRVN
jgi:hypothetical protein